MKIKCRISGLQIEVQHIPAYIESYHPIFYLPYPRLVPLYKKYFYRELSPEESYLTFLALLNSTEAIIWSSPCTLNPNTIDTERLISKNIRQLIAVIEKTNEITIPSFKQPSFRISLDNADLSNIHIYINEWAKNILAFQQGYKEQIITKKIKEVEARLEYAINAGMHNASVLATWADLSAEFPKHLRDSYKYIIQICYNKEKVFRIKTADIREVRDYCLENILPGSIYYHTLIETLEAGIKNKAAYLGYSIVEDDHDHSHSHSHSPTIKEAQNKLIQAMNRRKK